MKIRLGTLKRVISESYDLETRIAKLTEFTDRYGAAFEAVGLGDHALDISDCDDTFIVALGQFCERWASEQ